MSFYGLTNSSALSSRSCNGDVHEPSSDDEMFVNSRLGLEGYDRPQSLFLELEEANYCEKLKYTMSPLFSPLTPQNEQDAIIFSINLCGKNFGELGLFEPDISILDWEGFKSYLCSSLNLENSESFIISYEDDDGDKIPIQSEIEYNEALRLAKDRSMNHEKFHLNINRMSSGFPRTLRSLVSSSLRRVNSVGGNRQAPPPTQKRSITTSTSFIDLTNRNFELVDVKNSNYTPDFPESLTSWGGKTILPIRLVLDFDTEQNSVMRLFNCVNDSFAVMNYTVKPFDKLNYNKNCLFNKFPIAEAADDKKEVSYQLDLTCLLSRDDNKEAPVWFQDSMQKMKGNMINDISTILNENFQDFVGNLHDFDVEEKLRRLVSYDQCKGHSCSRQTSVESKLEEEITRMKERQDKHLKEIQSLQDLKAKIEENQIQLFAFIQKSNDNLERKFTWQEPNRQNIPIQEQLLCAEERERVFSRIQGCSQRLNLGSSMINASVNNMQKMLNSKLSAAPASMNAKFCSDITYPDGCRVLYGQRCTKTWKIQNNGIQAWCSDVKLVCLENFELSRGLNPVLLETKCPPLAPDEHGYISIDFIAPKLTGNFMNKWCFKLNDAEFGDILWCSVKTCDPDDVRPSPMVEKGPLATVLNKILSLLSQHRPEFDDASECKEELDLVVNYLQKSNLNSYLAIKSFLKASPSTYDTNYLQDNQDLSVTNAHYPINDQEIFEETATTFKDPTYELRDEEVDHKDNRGTPETEEANSLHFRSQKVITQSSTFDRIAAPQNLSRIPIDDYEDREVSEYCDSHSEMVNSEEEEDYPSDALEYEETNARPALATNPLEDQLRVETKGDEVYQESETENDYEETDHDDEEEGTEFDDDRGEEEEDDLVTESESEMIEEEEARRLESTSRSCIDKKFTLFKDNFNQNVQVKLDFEVLSRPSAIQTSASTSTMQSLTQAQTGPLTFREQHFTTSGCSMPPPPIPVQVPESDDDFDGVFIPEVDLPLNRHIQRTDDTSSKDEDSSSSSTSSFSECEDEDLPLAPAENVPSIRDGHEDEEEEASVGQYPMAQSRSIYDSGLENGEDATFDNDDETSHDSTTELANNISSHDPEPVAVNDFTPEVDETRQDIRPDPSCNQAEEDSNEVVKTDDNTEQIEESGRLPSSNSGTTSTSPTLLEAIPSSSDSVDPLVTTQSEEDPTDIVSK